MVIERLNKFTNNETLVNYQNYTLDNITKIFGHYGNPHKDLKLIHIAGTNGKGSVAYMLNSIFIKSGYSTGLYTSPHLLKINERIKINNADISDNDLNRYIDDLLELLESDETLAPTFFDIITLFAFRHFYENNVDIAIIETGLGGRLDSTNVVNPLCSIITEISTDHTAVLGDNIIDITSEKAGIIKSNTPVITSNNNSDVIKVISDEAVKKKSDLIIYKKDFIISNIKKTEYGYIFDYELSINSKNIKIADIEIDTYAEFQVYNCSQAITAVLTLNNIYGNITEDTIKKAVKTVDIPGRFQVLSRKPLVIFDPAHNSSALSLVIELLCKFYSDKKITVVLSLMKDKDYDSIISTIIEFGASIIYYELDEDRSYKASDGSYEDNFKEIVNNTVDLHNILNSLNTEDSLLFFTGSFRLYKIALDAANNM